MSETLRRLFWLMVLVVLAFVASRATSASAADKPLVTVLPIPTRDVPTSDQDAILAAIARQLRSQFAVNVISGRAVGRAVWGTSGTGLEEAAQTFTRKVGDAKQAYAHLQIKKAQDLLKDARRLEDFAGPEIRENATFTDLHLYSGLVFLAQGNSESAASEFRLAVSHDNGLALSPKKFPPDVIAAFEKAKRELLSGNPVQVSFESKPQGAAVLIDGRSVGATPVGGTPVFPGHHFVRLDLEGYSTWTLSIPEGIAPPEIKALLVPLWTGQAPAELLPIISASDQLDEPVMSKLRKLAGFFHADALLFVLLSKDGANTHAGVRLYLARPEMLARARMFNLGSNPAQFDSKVQGVVKTLDSILQIQKGPAVAAASQPTTGQTSGGGQPAGGSGPAKPQPKQGAVAVPPPQTGSGGQDFIPLPPSGVVGTAAQPEEHPAQPPGAQPEPEGGGTAWYKSWWFWTITGVVVAGGAAGLTVWLLRPSPTWTLVVQPN